MASRPRSIRVDAIGVPNHDPIVAPAADAITHAWAEDAPRAAADVIAAPTAHPRVTPTR